jgi:prepilin-type N-terminal cleavage/methylation domain-containing protein
MKTASKKGFTYIEVLMALTISSFILTASYATIMSLAKGSESMINYSEMNAQSRVALEMLGRDSRMARDVELATETAVMLEREIGDTVFDIYYAFNDKTGTFSRTIYQNDNLSDPAKKTLSTRDDAQLTFLYDVEQLAFTYYNYRQSKTTNTREVKHVQIEGILERRVLNVYNTNYIISARFMMRNKDVTN